MRKIHEVLSDRDRCSTCQQDSTHWVVAKNDDGYAYNFDLPCGHSWGEQPHLTPEEIALAMLMVNP